MAHFHFLAFGIFLFPEVGFDSQWRDVCMHLGCQEIIYLSGLDKQKFACCLSLCQSSDSEEVLVQGRRASLSDLRSVEDIEALSVRQLKEILARNFVDYKGCCEKWELMERVTRLYHDQKDLQNMGKEFGVIGCISMRTRAQLSTVTVM